jgi:hypothetical protein
LAAEVKRIQEQVSAFERELGGRDTATVAAAPAAPAPAVDVAANDAAIRAEFPNPLTFPELANAWGEGTLSELDSLLEQAVRAPLKARMVRDGLKGPSKEELLIQWVNQAGKAYAANPAAFVAYEPFIQRLAVNYPNAPTELGRKVSAFQRILKAWSVAEHEDLGRRLLAEQKQG